MKSKWIYITVCLSSVFSLSCKSSENEEAKNGQLQEQKMHARFAESPENVYDHKTERSGSRVDRPDLEEFYEEFLKGEDAMKAHIRNLLDEDEEGAIKTLTDLKAELDYRLVGMTLLEYYKEKGDIEAGLAHFATLGSNVTLAAPLLSEFVDVYWKEKPEKAMDWIKNHATYTGVESAAMRIGEQIGESENPGIEIEKMLDESVAENVRRYYVASAVESWMEKDLNAAFEFMSQVAPHPVYDETYYEMAGTSAALDPEASIEWASLITDYGLKKSAMDLAKANWRANDPEAFAQWEASQQAQN